MNAYIFAEFNQRIAGEVVVPGSDKAFCDSVHRSSLYDPISVLL
jgi:hypothetical protein